MKKIAGHFLRILISLAAIGCIVFFLRHKLHEAIQILQHDVSWPVFLLTILLYFIVVLLLSHRLHLIWDSQKISCGYFKVLGISFSGLFFNFFLPSAVGGDLIKIYYASRICRSKVKATTSVMMDRLLGFVIVILMGVTAIAFQRKTIHDPFIYGAMGIFAIIVISFSLLFLSRRVGHRFRFLSRFIPPGKILDVLKNLFHSFRDYRTKLAILSYGLFLSLVIQSIIVLIYYYMAQSLNCDLPLYVFFTIVPVATVVSMIPSIGGLGVREAGSVYLLSRYLSSERALALTLLFDVLIYGFGLIGGVVFAFLGQEDHLSIKQMETFDESQPKTR